MAYQTSMPQIGKPEAQAEMLSEFSGKDGRKDTLIDLEQYRMNQDNKPLDGQIKLEE